MKDLFADYLYTNAFPYDPSFSIILPYNENCTLEHWILIPCLKKHQESLIFPKGV